MEVPAENRIQANAYFILEENTDKIIQRDKHQWKEEKARGGYTFNLISNLSTQPISIILYQRALSGRKVPALKTRY